MSTECPHGVPIFCLSTQIRRGNSHFNIFLIRIFFISYRNLMGFDTANCIDIKLLLHIIIMCTEHYLRNGNKCFARKQSCDKNHYMVSKKIYQNQQKKLRLLYVTNLLINYSFSGITFVTRSIFFDNDIAIKKLFKLHMFWYLLMVRQTMEIVVFGKRLCFFNKNQIKMLSKNTVQKPTNN